MIYRRMILIMTMLVLASQSGRSQVADVPPAAPAALTPKSVARATLLFKVEYHGGEINAILSSLLKSEPLQQEAVQRVAKELLKDAPAELLQVDFIATNWSQSADVQVHSYDERLPAKNVLQAWRDTLAEKLVVMDTTGRRLVEQAAQEEVRVAELAVKLSAEHDELTKLAVTNRVELDPAVAMQKRIRLETELQGLSVEVQGVEARKDAIERQIASLAKKASAGASATDAIHVELAKSIEARRKVVEFRQKQLAVGFQGSSVGDVEQAKDELAQAEVELARYRRTLADAAGGQRIADLQHRLDDTAIEFVETMTKLRAIEKLADQSRHQSAEIEMKRIHVELLEQDYRRAREELGQLESKLRQHVSPSVTLIPLN